MLLLSIQVIFKTPPEVSEKIKIRKFPHNVHVPVPPPGDLVKSRLLITINQPRNQLWKKIFYSRTSRRGITRRTGRNRLDPIDAGQALSLILHFFLTSNGEYLENQGDPGIMTGFAKGAFWGMLHSILFFMIAFFCLKKGLPLTVALLTGLAAWILVAAMHQWLLK
jgi:hypothetical protein